MFADNEILQNVKWIGVVIMYMKQLKRRIDPGYRYSTYKKRLNIRYFYQLWYRLYIKKIKKEF